MIIYIFLVTIRIQFFFFSRFGSIFGSRLFGHTVLSIFDFTFLVIGVWIVDQEIKKKKNNPDPDPWIHGPKKFNENPQHIAYTHE